MSLIAELNRRNVLRVALLYIVLGWFCLQIIEILLVALNYGDWIYRFLFGFGVICFPLILIFSYIFEITPEGLQKEHMVEPESSITRRTGRNINRVTLIILLLCVVLELVRWFMT
ncbi:MAG: adenylate cyclase [Lysobacterales bacterium]|jgi:adenylate cyclase